MLKAGFRKCHRRPQHRLTLGCELHALCSCVLQRQANTNPPHLPRIPTKCRDNGNCTVCSWLKLATNEPASCKTRFTWGRVWELKNGHNSVTVLNRAHVYMNFFHHKDLGNNLLQLCPKVVKHPVYTLYILYNEMYFLHINFHIVIIQPSLARIYLPMTKVFVTYFNLWPRAMHLYQTV